jgi:hypothetical protein
MWQPATKAEAFLRKAKQQSSQYDIIQNLIQAVDELSREIKRIDSDMRKVRRDVQTHRRF